MPGSQTITYPETPTYQYPRHNFVCWYLMKTGFRGTLGMSQESGSIESKVSDRFTPIYNETGSKIDVYVNYTDYSQFLDNANGGQGSKGFAFWALRSPIP